MAVMWLSLVKSLQMVHISLIYLHIIISTPKKSFTITSTCTMKRCTLSCCEFVFTFLLILSLSYMYYFSSWFGNWNKFMRNVSKNRIEKLNACELNVQKRILIPFHPCSWILKTGAGTIVACSVAWWFVHSLYPPNGSSDFDEILVRGDSPQHRSRTLWPDSPSWKMAAQIDFLFITPEFFIKYIFRNISRTVGPIAMKFLVSGIWIKATAFQTSQAWFRHLQKWRR